MKSLNYTSKESTIEVKGEEFSSIDFRRVPDLKIRLAGKSIPLEKYAIKQCEHFLAQKWLFLPSLVRSDIWTNQIRSILSKRNCCFRTFPSFDCFS